MSFCFANRFNLKDKLELERIERVENVFAGLSPKNPSLVMAMMLPKFLARNFAGNLVRQMQDFFGFFNDLYAEHEKTFDPEVMRDFIDVYLSERKRVTTENVKNSSFYGEHGKLSYVNTMFDLFLVMLEEIPTVPFFLNVKLPTGRIRDNQHISEVPPALHDQLPVSAKSRSSRA